MLLNMYFYMVFLFFMLMSLLFLVFLSLTLIEENLYVLEWNYIIFDFFLDFKFMFYFDFLSNIFLLIVSMVSSSTFLYSSVYMKKDYSIKKFLLLTFLFVMSMFLVILSMNFITILIGWDCLGVVSYFLVIYYYSDSSDYSGMVTIMTNRIGDIGMIFGMFLIFLINDMNFYIIKNWDSCIYLFSYTMLFSGFTKSAQYPFFVWLPLAMAAPTPISALVHSSTLVTAGVYLFIRFDFLYKFDSNFNLFLLLLTGITMFIASMGAMSEFDMKKIIAYSTLSQLSLMMMVVLMGNELFSFFHILTHALFKALMFLCSGVMIHSCYENQDIRCYSFTIKYNLYISCLFFICSMSLSGFPFLSGFYSKDMILEFFYFMNYNGFYFMMLIFNTLITGIYSLRVIWYSMMLPYKNMKLVMFIIWDNINYSLFYLFFFMLVSGSVIYWMLMLKFNMFYFNFFTKSFNMVLVLLFFIIFGFLIKYKFVMLYLMNILILLKSLTMLQSILFNKLFMSSLMYSLFFEKLAVLFLYKNLGKMHYSLNNLISSFKLMKIYFMILFMLSVMLFILSL